MGGCPPINSVYVQYPQCKAPMTIWFLTTWTEIDYSGHFFRASGGNASAYINEGSVLTEQSDLVKNHTHGYAHSHEYTPSGKIASTSGGTDNKTSGMSANESHGHQILLGNAGQSISNVYAGSSICSNNKSYESDYRTNYYYGGEYGPVIKNTSVAHTHNAYFTGSSSTTTSQSKTITDGNDTNATETRPINYTIKIWQRTA